MSYILDAVKKAEAERERGTVPGLNARQMTSSIHVHYPRNPNSVWLALLASLLVLAIAAALWIWREAAHTQPSPPMAVLAPVAAPPKNPPAPAPAPVATPVAEAAVIPFQSVPQPARPAVFPLTAGKAQPSAAPQVNAAHHADNLAKPVDRPAPQLQVKPAPPPAQPQVPIARTPSGSIPMLSELPENVRRQIPALNISGAVHSESPREWTLLVNDQVLAQGSQVTPEVRLEEINDTSATFSFHGQRFRMNH